MEHEPLFTNTIALPPELIPLLTDSWVCEYSSIRKNGTPVTHPLLPWPGEDGRTIDINTGLAYPTKAEMARNNPHVCLLYSDPTCLRWADDNPPTVLVYGHATVYDSDLQANTDRYVQGMITRTQTWRKVPMFILRRMIGYFARIWIAVTPLKVLWWSEGDLEKPPKRWYAPDGTRAPASDPRPKPLSKPHKPLVIVSTDWYSDLVYALDNLGKPILTVVDEDGYPVPFRVNSGSLQSDGMQLELPLAFPTKAQGCACVSFHKEHMKNGELDVLMNMAFTGIVSRDGANALFQVKRRLPASNIKFGITGMVSGFRFIRSTEKRLNAEAARRGQPVPVVRRMK